MSRRVEAEFELFVERAVSDLALKGGMSFGLLVRSLPGVYPTAAKNALERLVQRGCLPTVAGERILSQAAAELAPDLATGCAVTETLPAPHPLDFEWRYASNAVNRILALCDGIRVAGPLLLLGAPSVASEAVRRQPKRPVTVIDLNAEVVKALRKSEGLVQTLLCDLTRDALPALPPALTVVCDPPWYPDDLRAFLWAACKLAQPRATVLVSLPPLGTRPGIQEERDRLVSYATGLGLDLVGVTIGALPYVSPPFERNALRADGVLGAPLDWRRGDLAEFVWLGGDLGPRPSVTARKDDWVEVVVSGIRIRVRSQSVNSFADPRLLPIVAGDILPTVSRRDPRRLQAMVWSAGNRIFGCEGPNVLVQIPRAIASRQAPVPGVQAMLGRELTRGERDQVQRTAAQIKELVQTERNEQASWNEQRRKEGLSTVTI